MPFNDSNTLYCYNHPQKEAETTCRSCLQPICSVCTVDVDFTDYCPQCVKKKALIKRVLIASLILVIATALTFTIKHYTSREKPFNYGRYTFKVKELQQCLEREPGDRRKIIELGEILVEAGNYREAIRVCKEFEKSNGKHLRLNWITYGAYQALSEFDNAVVEVTELIDDAPYDSDYRWWRGQLYEEMKDYDKAIIDYQQTIALKPAVGNIPFNLSTVLEKAGRGCEAAHPIEQFLYYYPEYRTNSEIKLRLEHLYQNYDCGVPYAEGKTKIRFSSNATSIKVKVTLNGSYKGNFIFDTGATHVVINDKVAKKLGINLSNTAPMLVQTAGGIVKSKATVVDKVSLSGATANKVNIAIIDSKELGENIDGLLGLSFISRFNITIDYKKGIIDLTSRETV